MRATFEIFAILFLSASVVRADPATTQPVLVPTTRPASSSVRGHVSAAVGWDLQKPDLSHAVVYLMPDPILGACAVPAPRATMGQRDKTFIPSFMVVPCGTEVEFPNWDHIAHNVFSRSKAAPAFDLDRYPYGYSKTRTFDKIGVVQVFCNIHQQMRAVIVVTPNAFFARADSEGRFELKDVPPGRHELVVWHERCEDQHRVIDVKANEALDLNFALQETRRSIIANDPPEHRAAYGVERGLGVKRERLDLPVVKDAHPAPPQDQPAH